MGILDEILRRAPGIAAQGLAGRFQGQQIRRTQDRQDRLDEAEMSQRALRDMLLQGNFERQQAADARAAQREPLEQEQIKAQTEAARALAAQRETPRPEAPRNIDPLSPAGIKARQDLARYEAGLRPSAGQAPGKILPASEVSHLNAYKSILKAAEASRDALQGAISSKENVTGPLTGLVSKGMEAFGKASPTAISARAKLANVASEIMLQRSGGAVSDAEFQRLQPFLPSKFDREENAVQKLADLITYLQSKKDDAEAGFQEAGYRVGTPAGEAAPEDHSAAKKELNESRKRRGLPPLP